MYVNNMSVNRALWAALVLSILIYNRGEAADQLEEPQECIRWFRDLRTAFFNQKSDSTNCQAPSDGDMLKNIFSLTPLELLQNTMLVIAYRTTTCTESSSSKISGNVTNVNTTEHEDCCNSHLELSANCKVFIVLKAALYETIYPPLTFIYAFPHIMAEMTKKDFYKKIRKYGVKGYYWNVPPFCKGNAYNQKNILKDFSAEIRHLITSGEEGPINLDKVYEYEPKESWMKTLEQDGRWSIHLLPVLIFLLVGPGLVLSIGSYMETINIALIKSKFAAECLYTAMLVGSFFMIYLLANLLLANYSLYSYFLEKQSEAFGYVSHLIKPDAYIGLGVFVALIVILLLEFPLIVGYFTRSSYIPNIQDQSAVSRVRKVVESIGWFGIIGFIQCCSFFIFYAIIFTLINPMYSILMISLSATLMAIVALIILTLCMTIVSCCTTCSIPKCFRLSMLIVLIVIVATGSFLFKVIENDPFTTTEPTGTMSIISSLFSSAVLASLGYLAKKIIFTKITDEIKDFDQLKRNSHVSLELANVNSSSDLESSHNKEGAEASSSCSENTSESPSSVL